MNATLFPQPFLQISYKIYLPQPESSHVQSAIRYKIILSVPTFTTLSVVSGRNATSTL